MGWLGRFFNKLFESFTPTQRRAIFIIVQGGLAIALIAYFTYQASYDVKVTPCTPGEYPVRCYHINQQTCEAVWTQSAESCKATIGRMSFSATRLIGPIMFKCQLAGLDKMLAASRVSNPDCDERHTDLIEWEKRNPDFQ